MRLTAITFVLLLIDVYANSSPPILSKPIAQRGMPVRVHVFEDYETDIEKRWWLAGKAVTENVPPSLSDSVPNRRPYRATETKDFDL